MLRMADKSSSFRIYAGEVTALHDSAIRGFASDNYSGVHHEVLAAMTSANGGHQIAYGEDAYTSRLQDVVRGHFGPRAEAYPVFNGTGANVTGLQAMLPRWGAVIAATSAHINVDEGGAPERVGGMKILAVPAPGGKLTPDLVDREAWGWGDEHRAQPLVVSITQSTEHGTVYSPDEVRALADHAHARGMLLHMDGSRIANAAASLGVSLAELSDGVDVLSLGGTKNGAMLAEAVTVLNPEAVTGMVYLRKLNMQLASKMRFVSAQLIALYEGDLWLRNASHANAMATRLRAGIDAKINAGVMPGVRFTQPTEANALFLTLPSGVADALRENFHFYDWDAATGEVRWVCSFDTTEDDVDSLIDALTNLIAARPKK